MLIYASKRMAWIEVVGTGEGIPGEDYDFVAFKHHTSKLTSFDDLAGIETYGFHGEALSPLYALYESITVTVAMPEGAPMATALEFDKWSGFSLVLARSLNRWNHSAHLSTQLMKLPVRDYVHTAIHSFPVRWKEFEPHAMLKFGEVPTLTSAYALVPCQRENGGIKPTLIQVPDTVKKMLRIQTDGFTSLKSSITAPWVSKAVEQVVL